MGEPTRKRKDPCLHDKLRPAVEAGRLVSPELGDYGDQAGAWPDAGWPACAERPRRARWR
jgi:hypothetical protein